MKIAFVQHLYYEFLGLGYLYSAIKDLAHDAELFIIPNDKSKEIADLIDFRPDLIAFSCTTGQHLISISIAKEAKERLRAAKVLLGGPHPTFFPDVIKEDPIDMIMRGESEISFRDLVVRMAEGEDFTSVNNLWIKDKGEIIKKDVGPLIEDLDTLAFPNRSLFYKKYPFLNKSQKAVIGTRGCPYRCSFCFNHAFLKLYRGKGKAVRYRTARNVIEEIVWLRNKFRLRTVLFNDDTLIINKSWFLELMKCYRTMEVKLPFTCLIRADIADEEIISALKDSGCVCAMFGIETGDEDLRNGVLQKKMSDEQIIRTARFLKKYRIKFRTYNILGFPEETLAQAYKTIDINRRIKTDYPWCSLFQPYPGTELGEYAREKGLMENNDFSASFFVASNLKNKYKNELLNIHNLFFYFIKSAFLYKLSGKIIKIRPNKVFRFLFLMSYAWCFFRSENIRFKELVSIALHNARDFVFRK
jgi:anaerobic magnesium-protoporphyrin IX monomethyl ester cyclase